jgi:hypothetical protein
VTDARPELCIPSVPPQYLPSFFLVQVSSTTYSKSTRSGRGIATIGMVFGVFVRHGKSAWTVLSMRIIPATVVHGFNADLEVGLNSRRIAALQEPIRTVRTWLARRVPVQVLDHIRRGPCVAKVKSCFVITTPKKATLYFVYSVPMDASRPS